MNNNLNKNIKDRILDQIKEDKIDMHSKYYFVFKYIALIFVSVVVLVLSVFILNFILFSIRISGHGNLLLFGTPGLMKFILIFPWYLLVIDIIFISILESLLRKFRFGYRTPVLYLFFIVFIFTLSSGFLIDRGTRINDQLLDRAERKALPIPFNDMYKGARRAPVPSAGICRCMIVGMNDNTLTVVYEQKGDLKHIMVILPKKKNRIEKGILEVGNTVFIAGDMQEGVIHAFGIHSDMPRKIRK